MENTRKELSGNLNGWKKKDVVLGFIVPFFLLAVGMVSPCFTDSFKVIFCAFVPFYGWGCFASFGSKKVRELIFCWHFISSILSLVFVSICSWTTFVVNFVVAACFALYSFISISSDYYWNIWWWLGGGRDDE